VIHFAQDGPVAANAAVRCNYCLVLVDTVIEPAGVEVDAEGEVVAASSDRATVVACVKLAHPASVVVEEARALDMQDLEKPMLFLHSEQSAATLLVAEVLVVELAARAHSAAAVAAIGPVVLLQRRLAVLLRSRRA
jgi:hypothetical protein